MEPISVRLGRWIETTAGEPLPDPVREKAMTFLLDGLGLGRAAAAEPATRALVGSPLLSLGDHGCWVWAAGRRAALSDAVMLNGFAVHARFQDDCDMTAWSHPGSMVLPAAITMGEAAGASLERVLRAIVCGYAVHHWLGAEEKVGAAIVARSFRASPTIGPVAAAAAAAAAIGLDAEGAGNAIAIAAAVAGGVIDTVGSGSSDWRFQNGSSAWRGAMAAILAREGIDGAPGIIESPKGFVRAFAGIEPPAELERDPDTESVLTVWAKRYPTLGDNMAVAAAAVDLAGEVGPGAIASIDVHQNEHFASYPGTAYRGPFAKPTQAIASTAFAVSAALSRGDITFDLYSSAREDPEILALVDKVTVHPEAGYDYLDGKVVVTTADGRSVSRETSELPRELFYRDAPAATEAFASVLAEAGIGGDARGFGAALFDRDGEIPIDEVLVDAMALGA